MSSSAAIKFPPQASAPVSGIRGSEPPSVSRKAISPVDAVFTPPTKKWVETVRKSSEDLDNNNQIQTLSPLPKKADVAVQPPPDLDKDQAPTLLSLLENGNGPLQLMAFDLDHNQIIELTAQIINDAVEAAVFDLVHIAAAQANASNNTAH